MPYAAIRLPFHHIASHLATGKNFIRSAFCASFLRTSVSVALTNTPLGDGVATCTWPFTPCMRTQLAALKVESFSCNELMTREDHLAW